MTKREIEHYFGVKDHTKSKTKKFLFVFLITLSCFCDILSSEKKVSAVVSPFKVLLIDIVTDSAPEREIKLLSQKRNYLMPAEF